MLSQRPHANCPPSPVTIKFSRSLYNSVRKGFVQVRIAQVESVPVRSEQSTGDDSLQPFFSPDDLKLGDGELSRVKRAVEGANSDVFRCVGCEDTTCQGSSGCHNTEWRLDDAGYLRAILTARVYDVAVRCRIPRRACTNVLLAAATAKWLPLKTAPRQFGKARELLQVESPLERAPLLSASTGNEIYLKREDQQAVFSFKLRGAFNKMASLPREALRAGVITSSAGNHAQGVALAARRLGTSAVICMPVTTPEIKVAAVKALGAEVRLVGESYTETQSHAVAASAAEGRSFIAPYDDPLTIAGQGTVAVEVLKQLGARVDSLRAVFVPIGGGGLIAGIAAYVKALRPDVAVIGVEPSGANCMALSLREGRRVALSKVDAFADGVAVKTVGVVRFSGFACNVYLFRWEETFRLCQGLVDGVVLVDNAAISAAIKDVFAETRSVLEPAGALALAGAKAYLRRHNWSGETVVAVTSGANMNFDRLRLVADLANLGLHTEAMLAVSIPEAPGSFQKFVDTLLLVDGTPGCSGSANIDVTEFKYRYSVDRDAKILCSISAPKPADVDCATARLAAAGFDCENVTDSRAAQVHLRHMVGGRPRSYSGAIEDERITVIHFPEKVGALRQFLEALKGGFNVTMFHYRQTGNRSSSALLGIQVPSSTRAEYAKAVAKLEPLDFIFEDLDVETRSLFDQFIS